MFYMFPIVFCLSSESRLRPISGLADQVEILCGASLGSGIEILFAISCSHDQDDHHAHI